MNAAPTIAHYIPSDYDGVWALHQKAIRNNDGFVKKLTFHTDIHNIPIVYQTFFVMRHNNAIIGMIGLKKISDETSEIKRLQIDPAYQGHSYGRQLMEKISNFAREQKIKLLQLDVSAPQIKAHNLYLSLGFRITSVQERSLGPDNEQFVSTFMEKVL